MKGFYSSRKKNVGGRITAREKITMYAKIILFLRKIIAYRCSKTQFFKDMNIKIRPLGLNWAV